MCIAHRYCELQVPCQVRAQSAKIMTSSVHDNEATTSTSFTTDKDLLRRTFTKTLCVLSIRSLTHLPGAQF